MVVDPLVWGDFGDLGPLEVEVVVFLHELEDGFFFENLLVVGEEGEDGPERLLGVVEGGIHGDGDELCGGGEW